MISRDEVNAALDAFGGRHGVSDVQLDDDDFAVLEFAEDQAILVSYLDDKQRLSLVSPIGTTDVAESAFAESALLKFLLRLNRPRNPFDDARIALDDESETLLLVRTIESLDSNDTFADAFEAFATHVLQLIDELDNTDFENMDGEDFALPSAPEFPAVRV